MGQAAALEGFDRSKEAFASAMATVPDSALAFLKPGDDYALGGLVVHVNAILEHYTRVLDGLLAAGFGEFRAAAPPDVAERTRRGLTAAARAAEMSRLDQLHSGFRERAAGVAEPDFERAAPVVFEGSPDPYPTSPGAILGWLRDHYDEHVPHIVQLLGDFATRS